MNQLQESEVKVQVNTALPPCCLRIFRDKFIFVGTYELDKPSGNRTGSVDLFDDELKLIKSYPTYGAILDLQLSPFDDTLMVTGHSTGNIMLWKIYYEKESDDGNCTVPTINMIGNVQIFDIDVLVTSLRFSPLDPKLVSVTNTVGETATIDIEVGEQQGEVFSSRQVLDNYSKLDNKSITVQDNEEMIIESIVETFEEQHGLECWTSEFGYLNPFENVLFTGGDDATIVAHDLRMKSNIWSNNRIHEAGVVAIKCSTPNFRSSQNTSIITGSYDDHIRVLDLRMAGDMIYPGRNVPATQVSSLNLGGGVWRFSEMPDTIKTSEQDTLMVCCMYDGAKIVTMDDNVSNSEEGEYFKIQHYLKKGHESMCYGGDWSESFITTCSFYDKSLQKWNPYT